MNFHIISLGCNKNTADSEQIAKNFVSRNCEWVSDPAKSDLLLINTCGFIDDAKEESLNTIMKAVSLKKKKPSIKVAAFGCLIKRYYDDIKSKIPELDYIFDFLTPRQIEKMISDFPETGKNCYSPKRFFTPPHIGFLKIAEGCDNRCSYCAIPNIRGPFVSLDENQIIETANSLAESGAKEISIVAQDITRYGLDKTGKCQLPELVKKVSEIKGIEWIRLHYMHPRGLTNELIDELYSISKVVPYFDVPFQHISSKLIKTMNRHTTPEHMISLLKHIRDKYPKAVFRTTFIVGFPGETKKEFDELIDFVEEYPIDRVGAFMYSPEEGTPGALMPHQCRASTKQKRLDQLMTLQQLIIEERNKKLIGTVLPVIIDSVENGEAKARTMYDAWEVDNVTTIKKASKLEAGQIVNVKITDADAYDFIAKIV